VRKAAALLDDVVELVLAHTQSVEARSLLRIENEVVHQRDLQCDMR
jgi:hypothetical protein